MAPAGFTAFTSSLGRSLATCRSYPCPAKTDLKFGRFGMRPPRLLAIENQKPAIPVKPVFDIERQRADIAVRPLIYLGLPDLGPNNCGLALRSRRRTPSGRPTDCALSS